MLFKAHGLGNDYLVLVEGGPMTPERVRSLCDRHTGCGGDGILEPWTSAVADHGLRIWNPDGSLAEKSGNGLRIFAWWLSTWRGAGHAFTVGVHDPKGGPDAVVTCDIDGTEVTVDMGAATVGGVDVPFVVDGAELRAVLVDVGNPHCVIFVDQDPDALPWRRWGELLEQHEAFPRRTNVQVARVLAADRVELRIWERGAGPTLASGSSSCAVAAAAVHTGRCDAGAITLVMPGGTLSVEVGATLRLKGPVAPVAVCLPLLAQQ